MKMSRKSILTVSALFFASVLAPAFAAGPDGYPAYSGPPVELTMWAWTSNENYSIDLFQKAYPSIKVKWTNVGGGGDEYTKILTATSAGSGLPDVIMSEYTYAPEFVQFGSFQAINKWVPESTYLQYFPKVTLKWTAQDGNIYGTPQDSGASTMVYRKDVFDKYGLTVPKTWAEFAVMAAKLHKANPKIQPISFPANWVLGPLGLVWQAGGKLFDYADGKWYIDFTNPTATKVFTYWAKLVKDGAVTPDMWWNSDWYKELSDGGAATVISGGWFPEWLQLNSPDAKGTWRVATLPQWDASKPMNGEMGGSGFYVSSQSKNPEAAALFVLWLNSHKDSILQLHDKAQLPVLWANSFINGLGPSLAGQEYPYFGGQKITPVSLEAMNQVAKNPQNAFTALPVMDFVSSSQETELKKFLDGQEDINAFLKNWQDAVVAFMAKQGFNNVVVGQLPK
jgi:multiple sugar transport system substrate-binding protein